LSHRLGPSGLWRRAQRLLPPDVLVTRSNNSRYDMKTVTLLLFATLLAAAINAQDLEQPSTPVAITVEGSFNFGPVDGFLQTPAGGRPGTSSRHRPTFDELGIDDVAFYDTRLDVQWHRLRVYGGYQFMRLNESETLSRPLIS